MIGKVTAFRALLQENGGLGEEDSGPAGDELGIKPSNLERCRQALIRLMERLAVFFPCPIFESDSVSYGSDDLKNISLVLYKCLHFNNL